MPTLLDRLSTRLKAAASVFTALPPSAGSGLAYYSPFNNGFTQGVSRLFRSRKREEYLEEYRGTVFSCVNAICDDFAEIDLRLYTGLKKTPDREEIDNHPALDLLQSVNPIMTAMDLFWETQANLELDGNSFWYLARDTSDNIQAIWPLRPDLVEPIPGKERWVETFLYRMGGKTWQIAPENILHLKTYNPLNPYRGIGTVMAAMASIDTQNSIRAWNQAFFDNGARPDTIIEYQGNLQKAERDRLQREWDDQYKGATKGHRASFLGNGLKVHVLDVSQKEMDFVEQNRVTRDDILSIFRVPQSVLGITQDMTYANAETTDYIFSKRTIRPKMRKLTNQLNEFFLPLFGDEEVHFDFADPVPQNRETVLAGYKFSLENGVMSRNEVRKLEGHEPVEGADALYVPNNLVEIGVAKTKARAARTVKVTPVNEVLGKMAKALAAGIAPAFKAMNEADDFESRGETWNKAQRADGDTAIADVSKVIKTFLAEQKDRTVAAFKDEATKAVKRVRNKAVNPDNVFDSAAEKKLFYKAVADSMKVVVEKEGAAAMDLVGVDQEFDANATAVATALSKQVKKFTGSVTAETSKAVRETIAAGVGDQLSVSDIADNIGNLASFSDSRAEMIARTEVTRAQGAADIQAWDQSGVVTKTIWYTALDERVCPDCMALHGTEVALGDSYYQKGDETDSGMSLDYGDTNSPPLHPNCRCSLLPVVG